MSQVVINVDLGLLIGLGATMGIFFLSILGCAFLVFARSAWSNREYGGSPDWGDRFFGALFFFCWVLFGFLPPLVLGISIGTHTAGVG